MAQKNWVGIGSIVLSTREHPVMVEPRGGGLVMFLLLFAVLAVLAVANAAWASPSPQGRPGRATVPRHPPP